MNKPIWRKGPPPSIGWWPASVCREHRSIRWWNGKWWSKSCYSCDPIEEVEQRAALREDWKQNRVEWTDRPDSWPERSKT